MPVRGARYLSTRHAIHRTVRGTSTNKEGKVRIERGVCAFDCGIAVNPEVVRVQMEGSIGYGLSAALREATPLVNGEVQTTNFDGYQPPRITEMPKIEEYIVPSNEAPTHPAIVLESIPAPC
jgi:isoquinoline 1-oxidoreductase beta subunit